jgi:uncharacterized protein YlxW (UPF0749 family)
VARARPPVVLAGIVAITGFLVVTTGFATNAASQKEEPRKTALINQILTQRRDVDDLDAAVAALRAQVDSAQADVSRKDAAAQQSQQERTDLSEAAGTTAMQGPATIVRVADAPRDEKTRSASAAPFGTDRVQDHDLQLIVNALFASGAEAVAVNDNRVSSITPIRAAGGTIVVNYRPVSSPYRVVAIGADKKAFERTTIAQNFSQWKDKFKLGYSVSASKKQTVPAYSGRVTIDDAQPAE